MNKNITNQMQSLRKISLLVDVSGELKPLSNTKLTRGSYRFVGLQVFIPITPNATGDPLCTVYRTTIDNAGVKRQFNKKKYSLFPVGKTTYPDKEYMCFECPLPKDYTDTVGELELVFTYTEIEDGKVSSRLASALYRTQVYEGGLADDDAELLPNNEVLTGLIDGLVFTLESIRSDVDDLLQSPDCTEANNVGTPKVEYAADGRLKFIEIKGNRGDIGLTPDITVDVKGLAAGSIPSIEKSGTVDKPLLTFGIPQGAKGDRGEPFAIKKTYPSVLLMLRYAPEDLLNGEFALIEAQNVDDPNNAKLYVKSDNEMFYVTDLSGARGFKGDKGDQGIQGGQGKQGDTGPVGPSGPQGTKGDKGDKGNTGESGVDIPLTTGFFRMAIKEDGHLWVVANDGTENPLRIDPETGHLILTIE